MSTPGCATCKMRQNYDEKPRSFVGRLWRWHIRFCPGWKKYMTSLPESERVELEAKYQIRRR